MANNIISPNDGAPVSSIDAGNRVRFIGDEHSPDMQVIGIAQGGLCVCGWFTPEEDGPMSSNQRSKFNVIQVAPVCLERINTVSKLVN